MVETQALDTSALKPMHKPFNPPNVSFTQIKKRESALKNDEATYSSVDDGEGSSSHSFEYQNRAPKEEFQVPSRPMSPE